MGNKILVDKNIQDGKRLIQLLKEDKFPISGAFWKLKTETNEWKLFIITKLVEEKGPTKTYTRIDNILEAHKDEIDIYLDEITVIKPKDKLSKIYRGIIKTSPKPLKDIRVSGGAFDSIYFEDLYIYKTNHK
jgi:hypothetical protein